MWWFLWFELPALVGILALVINHNWEMFILPKRR